MDDRQKNLLRAVIETYLVTAQPVGSLLLADRFDFDLSPATIRNELLELEASGYIAQPHTSAGRIPTVKGLRYYLDELMPEIRLNERFDNLMADYRNQWGLRGLARVLAEISDSAVVIGSDLSDYYYTGFSRLLAQPEFSDLDLVRSLSQSVDHLDQVLPKLFGKLSEEPTVFLGRGNPFGQSCSAMFISNGEDEHEIILGLLGPVRTNYPKNISLLQQAIKYLY